MATAEDLDLDFVDENIHKFRAYDFFGISKNKFTECKKKYIAACKIQDIWSGCSAKPGHAINNSILLKQIEEIREIRKTIEYNNAKIQKINDIIKEEIDNNAKIQ